MQSAKHVVVSVKQFPFAHRIAADRLAQLEALLCCERVRSGSVICERGRRGTRVYFVLTGQLAGYIASRRGREVITNVFGPGQLFGELAALDGGSRVRSVRALSTCELAALGAEEFDDWLQANPRAMRNLLSEFASNTRDLADRIYELSVHDVDTRVRLLLVRMLIEAGELHDGGVLDPAPSHAVIAAQIGANREAVSRALARFKCRGFITPGRRRIEVHDARALEAGL